MQRDGHGASPYDVSYMWGLSLDAGYVIADLPSAAFGPGGGGERWAIEQVYDVLCSIVAC